MVDPVRWTAPNKECGFVARTGAESRVPEADSWGWFRHGKFALEDLARRVAWQMVKEHDVSGDLVAGQVGPHIVLDRLGI